MTRGHTGLSARKTTSGGPPVSATVLGLWMPSWTRNDWWASELFVRPSRKVAKTTDWAAVKPDQPEVVGESGVFVPFGLLPQTA